MILWFLSFGLLSLLFFVLAIQYRPQVALGVVVPLSWCVPAWSGFYVGQDFLNVRTMVAIIALGSYSFFPKATFPWRLVPCDYAVIALIIVNVLSDVLSSEGDWKTLPIAYIEWGIPYLAGRLAFQSAEDLVWVWRTLSFTAVFLSLMTIFEAFSGTNLFETIYGLRPLDETIRDQQRWGIRRAYGICLHPLYNGVLLCFLGGWLWIAGWLAMRRRVNRLWLLAPLSLLGFFGPLATGTRGPFLAAFIVLMGAAMCYFRRLHWPGLGFCILLGLGMIVFQESIFMALDRWSGESYRGRRVDSVQFDDQNEKLSSARMRLTLFRIYKKPLLRAGLLGYGTDAVTPFPVNVPTGADEVRAMSEIFSVDNAYILLVLRLGYAGLMCFVAMEVLSLWQLIRVVQADPRRSMAIVAATLFGIVCSMMALLFIVWMPGEIGFPILWSLGAASGMYFNVRASKIAAM